MHRGSVLGWFWYTGARFWADFGTLGPGFWAGFGTLGLRLWAGFGTLGLRLWAGLVLCVKPPGCAFWGHLWVAFMAAFLVHRGSGFGYTGALVLGTPGLLFWADFGTLGPGFWAGFGTLGPGFWAGFGTLGLRLWAGMDQRPPCRLPQKAVFGKSIPFPFLEPDLPLFSDESIPLTLFGAKRYAFIFCSLSGTLSCESKKHTFFFPGTRFAVFFRRKHTTDPVWGEKVCFYFLLPVRYFILRK